ncbi:MAG: type II methionyl aminopeptidase [archaeon]|jgi:methionyl aminopeptidase|nr:type II methionyl aminopeptidase [archaeon]
MTEKQYGGATGRSLDSAGRKPAAGRGASQQERTERNAPLNKLSSDNNKSDKSDYANFIKAGKIASEVVKYAGTIIKPGVPLLEIAENIETKIISLGAKPAFPVNLSINEIAAHDTPAYNDARIASGLLKVDIGAHIEGYVADVAFSVDLEGNNTNKKLIEASELALQKAIEKINLGVSTNELGIAIESAIKSSKFTPIINLSGHSIEPWHLHSGITIPNHDNSQKKPLDSGIYAIEPFATSGLGSVKDGKPSGIYRVEKEGNVRDALAREVLAFICEEYETLPFCSRWIHKKFGTRGLLALKRIEDAGILHHYPQLIEVSGKPVSQAEHTVLIEKSRKVITTQ